MSEDPRVPFPNRVQQTGHDLLESLVIVGVFVAAPNLLRLFPEGTLSQELLEGLAIALRLSVAIAALIYVFMFRKTKPSQLGVEQMIPHDGLVLLRWGTISGGALAAIGSAGLIILHHHPDWVPQGWNLFAPLSESAGRPTVLEVIQSRVLIRDFGWLTILNLVLLAPVLEEVIFRGFLFGSLRKDFNLTISVLASAIVFGFAHNNLPISQLVGGVVFAMAYERTRTLAVPIILHVAGNLSLLAISWWVAQSLAV